MGRQIAILALCVAFCGCSTLKGWFSPASTPKQPDAPTSASSVAVLGNSLDTADQKVAAAVTVARENADNPAVVKAESGVALSYLPAPTEGDLAIARARAAKADPKTYTLAEADGRRLLAAVTRQFDTLKADQAEAKRVSGLKDAKIADLTKQLETAKAEARRDIWTLTGAALAVLAAAATFFVGWRVAAGIAAAAVLCGAIPHIIESPWFAWIAGVTVAVSAALFLWVVWDKARDAVNASKAATDQPDPSNPQP